jgi:chemotaxis protein CheY-P-specific phosphatase CheC
MNHASSPLTSLQAEMLRQILAGGNEQVRSVLQSLLGPSLQQVEIHTAMIRLSDLPEKFGEQPLITINISIDGDLNGEFFFLQSEQDFRALKMALAAVISEPVHTVNEATDYLIPNWLEHRPQVSPGETLGKVREALDDLSDRLFAAYLNTVYERFHMATFLELPVATIPDREQAVLRGALKKYGEVSERAFLVDTTCTLGDDSFQFWLAMLAEPGGLHTMLEALTKRD